MSFYLLDNFVLFLDTFSFSKSARVTSKCTLGTYGKRLSSNPENVKNFAREIHFDPKVANTSLNLPLDDGKLGTTFETGGEMFHEAKKLPITF